jgi:diketogulonate reductase-like aldo/keto reductase
MALKEEGKVRYLGVARSGRQNFDSMVQLIESGLIDFVQVNYSLVEPEAAERVLPAAADRGVAVIINRPFQNGNYFSMVRGKELPEWAADFDCHSWAQFSLKFILAHPAVNCVLTETTDPDHAIDNLGGGFGRLPNDQELAKMREVIRSM